jgi:hypothetical protein
MEAVEYEWVKFRDNRRSVYRGAPTQKLENAWDGLLQCRSLPAPASFILIPMSLSCNPDGAINVPYDKLESLGQSTEIDWRRVEPERGGGVAATLGAFYQIHCLVSEHFLSRDEIIFLLLWLTRTLPPESHPAVFIQG